MPAKKVLRTTDPLIKWTASILGIFIIYLSIHPFMTAWVASFTHNYALVKIWKDILVAVTAIIVVLWAVFRKCIDRAVWRDPVIITAIVYILYTLLLFAVMHTYENKSGYAALIFNLRFLTLFITVRLLLWGCDSTQLRPWLERGADLVIALGAIVSIFAILQVTVLPHNFMMHFGYDGVNTIAPVSTVDNDPNALRAFATLRGPNELGAYLILPLTLTLIRLWAKRPLHQYLLAGSLMLAALYFSHSRSALIGVIVSLIVVCVIKLRSKIKPRTVLAAAALSLIGGAAIIWASLCIPQVRLVVFHSSPSDSTLFEGSTSDHWYATIEGIRDVLHHPLGRGPGQAGPASFYNEDKNPRIAENYYVQIAQEDGIIGLALLLTIWTTMIVFLKRHIDEDIPIALLASFIGLSVVALTLHTWNDDPLSYTWWGIAALVFSLKEGQNGRATKQKTA